MKSSIIKLLEDKNELIKQIEAINTQIINCSNIINRLARIKWVPQRAITPNEAFVILLAKWVETQKSKPFLKFEENKSKSTENLLDEIFHTSNFLELSVEIIDDKAILSKISDEIVSEPYNEKQRMIDIRSLQSAKLVKIGLEDGKSLFFGKARRFYFMISEQYLRERYIEVSKNINELFFDNTYNDAIRKRPSMWIGSMNSNGLYRMIFGLIEEILAVATKKEIQVEILPMNRIKIICDSYEIANNSFAISDWTIVNNLSEFFEWQDSEQSFKTEKGILLLKEPFKNNFCGITVIFKPDKEIFNDVTLDYYRFLKRFIELASLNPYKITLSDRNNKNIIEIPNGINALMEMEIDDVYKKEIVRLDIHEPEVQAEIVLSFSYFHKEIQKSYVNNRRSQDGGTHVEGMLRGVRLAIGKFVNQYAKDPINSTELLIKKMNYIISVKIDNPRWYGSLRRKLKNLEIKKIIERNVESQLYSKLEENKEIMKSFYCLNE